jgi:hypothetical protein
MLRLNELNLLKKNNPAEVLQLFYRMQALSPFGIWALTLGFKCCGAAAASMPPYPFLQVTFRTVCFVCIQKNTPYKKKDQIQSSIHQAQHSTRVKYPSKTDAYCAW